MKILIFLTGALLIATAEPERSKSNSNSAEPIAVIELFTSQGCSSCPAADNLLNETIDKAQKSGPKIYGLSFHVSYWNHLGWKDPYSSEQFTQRQRQYASVMQASGVYTPQMVINGKYEFVGSDRAALQQNLRASLQKPSAYTITANPIIHNSQVEIQYALSGSPQGKLVNVALVEPSLKNYVPRGENEGRTLAHSNVVTSFGSQNASQEGTLSISLPKGSSEAIHVIIFIQDSKTMVIEGASEIKPTH